MAHISVMPREVLDWLQPATGQTFLDGTLGAGGHTRCLAERVHPHGQVIALDRDPTAINTAEQTLQKLPVSVCCSDYREFDQVLQQLEVPYVDGILLDLGLSSDQLDDEERGFSFDSDGPLDLRFDPTSGKPASNLVNRLPQAALADLIYQFGEERFSRRIARRIAEVRREKPIQRAVELAHIVRSCVPRSRGHRIDPATRTFQALRIAVNDELQALKSSLARFPDFMRHGSRLAIISFHSLEDRLVKQAFRDDPRYVILTKKPIRPNEAEQAQNPRCRSARLRVAERAAVP